MIVLENVDTLLQDSASDSDSKTDKKNKELIEIALTARFYEVQWIVVDSADFGSPQRRRRVYIVGVRRFTSSQWVLDIKAAGGYDAYFKRFVSMVDDCKADPPGINELLCRPCDPVPTLAVRHIQKHAAYGTQSEHIGRP